MNNLLKEFRDKSKNGKEIDSLIKKTPMLQNESLENLNSIDVINIYKGWVKNYPFLSMTTITKMMKTLNDYFDFCAENIDGWKNPMDSMEKRGKSEIIRIINEENVIIDLKHLPDNLLSKVEEKTVNKMEADTIKFMISALYDGLIVADIPYIKEKDIDFAENTVVIKGVKHKLSKRTMEFMKTAHENSGKIDNDFIMMNWKNSYIPIRVKVSTESLDYLERNQVSMRLNTLLKKYTDQMYDNFDSRCLIYLGMYDRMVAIFGKNETDDIISSSRGFQARKIIHKMIKPHFKEIGGRFLTTQTPTHLLTQLLGVMHN